MWSTSHQEHSYCSLVSTMQGYHKRWSCYASMNVCQIYIENIGICISTNRLVIIKRPWDWHSCVKSTQHCWLLSTSPSVTSMTTTTTTTRQKFNDVTVAWWAYSDLQFEMVKKKSSQTFGAAPKTCVQSTKPTKRQSRCLSNDCPIPLHVDAFCKWQIVALKWKSMKW